LISRLGLRTAHGRHRAAGEDPAGGDEGEGASPAPLPTPRRWGWWGPALLLAFFALSQGVAALAGIRYDATQLDGTAGPALFTQLADPNLLQHHLIQTLFYLHIQPPLFSMLVGLALKFSPFTMSVTFQLLSLLLGVVAALAMYDCALQLGASRITGVITGVVILGSSDVILYSNWSSYEWFCAVDVMVCAAGLLRWLRYRQLWCGYAVFAGAACALVLTRTLYEPIWLVVVLPLGLVGGRRLPHFRSAVIIGALMLGLVGLLVVKNVALFGVPGLSSWTGMDLDDATVKQLPAAELARLTANGTINSLWDLTPGVPAPVQSAFVPWTTYEKYYPHCHPTITGVPILDEQTTASGSPNFNYQCYLTVASAFLHDDIEAIRHDPGSYLGGQFDGWERSLESASIYPFLNETGNAKHLSTYDSWYRHIALLEIPFPRIVHSPSGDLPLPYYDHLGSFPRLDFTLILAGLAIVGRALRRLRRVRREPEALFYAFAAFTVLWTFVVGNAIDFGENNRFHFDVEILMLLLFGVAIERLVRRLRRQPERAAPDNPAGAGS
jgi:hypothetical protein